MKKICVITGNRADFGILKILINKIILSKKLELMLYVTGTHLLKKFGHTIDLIKKDKIRIKRKIFMYPEIMINKQDLGRSIGEAIMDFTDFFNIDNPDLVLVLGDRFEMFCAVIAATSLRIPIAHIHGGDNVQGGQIDEQIRHAITKFAHIHFPATKKSAERIQKMGEEKHRIFMCGSPSIDMLKNYTLLNKTQICRKLGLDYSKKIIICIFHPYIPEHKLAGKQMMRIINVLKRFVYQKVIIYPNNDLGNNLIISKINEIEDNDFKIFKNLDRIDYLSLLKNSDLMVGNSSSGVIDSSTFKIPVVNIGKRNRGRESAENVISCGFKDLFKSVLKGLTPEFKEICKNVKSPYGEGNASKKIVKILEDLKIDSKLIKKRLVL